jgi:adenylate cyclase
LDVALKVNMPGFWRTQLALATSYGQLGEREAARAALQSLLALRPDFAELAHEELGKWWDPALVLHLIDGLRKAGMEIQGEEGKGAKEGKETGSGAERLEEGFWVAVLPFRCTGANADLTALAEGLSEEIVTGLSRFSYLRVIAHSSTLRYSSETADVRAVGKELGARYVMEGSLRQSGPRLRLAVQLVDAGTGAHLWAETYDRPFRSEEIFALQDDLAPRIVSSVADMQGVLTYAMSEALRTRPADELSPYEALLRGFGYLRRISAEEHNAVRDILERAVQKAPSQSDCWAMLSAMYTNEYIHGFNALPDPLGRALQSARRAVEAAPSNHFAHYALAEASFFRREVQSFRQAAARVVALNRMDGYSTAYMGMLMAFAGDWEAGCGLIERGMQLNPNYPKWLWIGLWVNLYRKNDYESALDAALKIHVPQHWYPSAALAATHGQLGDREAGLKDVRELLAAKPDFAAVARQEFGKWHEPELVEHIVDGLRKASLELPPASSTSPSGA